MTPKNESIKKVVSSGPEKPWRERKTNKSLKPALKILQHMPDEKHCNEWKAIILQKHQVIHIDGAGDVIH